MSKEKIEAVIDLIELGAMSSNEDIVKCLRSALAEQPEQQDPFIYYRHYDGGTQDYPDEKTIPLYTSPPAQRTWVGLTGEERILCRSYDPEEAVAKTEAKLKEKNT